jgi:hypothetical protein
VRQLSAGNKDILALVAAIQAVFPRVSGSFTLGAAASTTVTQPGIAANGFPLLVPTNAAAATLMGSAKALYLSAVVAGASFTVATASGGNAAGTEIFAYVLVNP